MKQFLLEVQQTSKRELEWKLHRRGKIMETLNGRKFSVFLEFEKREKEEKLKESFKLSAPFTLREYIPAIDEIIRCVFIKFSF